MTSAHKKAISLPPSPFFLTNSQHSKCFRPLQLRNRLKALLRCSEPPKCLQRDRFDLYVEACLFFAPRGSIAGVELTPTPSSTNGPPTPRDNLPSSPMLLLECLNPLKPHALQVAVVGLDNISNITREQGCSRRLRSSPLGDEGLIELDELGCKRMQKSRGPRGLSRSEHPIQKRRRP